MTRFVPHLGHTVGAFEDVVGAPRGDVTPGDKEELRGLMGTCWGQGSASCRQPDVCFVWYGMRANNQSINQSINQPTNQVLNQQSINQSINQSIQQR
jgi:hypothetical protein